LGGSVQLSFFYSERRTDNMSRGIVFLTGISGLFFLCSCGQKDPAWSDLRSGDATKRADAVAQLAGKPDQAEKVIPVIVKALADESEGVRVAAVEGLAGLKNIPDTAKTKVKEAAASDSSTKVRKAAIGALVTVAPGDPTTVETLKKAMNDAAFEVAMEGCLKMTFVTDKGPAAKEVAEFLKRAVKEGKELEVLNVLQTSAVLLAQLGKKAAPAKTALEALLENPKLPERMKPVIEATISAIDGQGSMEDVMRAVSNVGSAGPGGPTGEVPIAPPPAP
jgi:hypothetical protein